jgi:hypothetical protein
MAIISISNRTDLLNELNKVRDTDDIIKLSGDIAEFIFPRNNNRKITIVAAGSKPPTMRGIMMGTSKTGGLKNNFAHLNKVPKATKLTGITLDGLRFEAQRFTSMKTPDGKIHEISISGRGIGWRCAGTSHPSGGGGYSENSNMRGLTGFSVCTDCVMSNLTFNGFANALFGGGTRNRFSHLRFEENHEDMIKYGGDQNNIYEWIECVGFMPVPGDVAMLFGWKRNESPHADLLQQMADIHDTTFRNIALDDTTGHVHFGLCRPPDGYPKSTNLTYDNLEGFCNNENGLAIKDVTGLTVRRIKLHMPPGTVSWGPHGKSNSAGPLIEIDPGTTGGKMDIGDLMALRFWGRSEGSPGSSKNNDHTKYPAGFKQIRRTKVTAGAECVGPGDRSA